MHCRKVFLKSSFDSVVVSEHADGHLIGRRLPLRIILESKRRLITGGSTILQLLENLNGYESLSD
jgi:hypothetical protein